MGQPSGYKDQLHSAPGTFEVEGSFTTDGANAPSVVRGAGFTVSAPSTGVYTITGRGTSSFPGWISAIADIRGATGHNDVATFTDIDTTTTPWTATLETQSAAGTAADLDGPDVSFRILFRSTTGLK